ncbi:MAG TPA: PhoU domain-containing protein [Candidatus Angelobacter sp.]|jgi:phosphate transport system protein|nr:PhoU domain-containing protein [Candidatus Angelobacter sp.]
MDHPVARSPVLHNRIVQPVIAMAKDVESMIDLAINALLSANAEATAGILQKESAVNASEMKNDAAILGVLEKGDLAREEIRQVVSMLKINKDLERMGDLAANIGRKVSELSQREGAQDYSDLQPMAIAVSHISRKTLRALIHSDLVLAANVVGSGTNVEFYRDYVFRNLKKRVEQGVAKREALHLILASRYLEQIAEHAGNVAESLIFWLNASQTDDHPYKQAIAV